MRLSLAACLFVCAFAQPSGYPEWELVYPENEPFVRELDILSTGCNPATREFLLGSESGYAIIGRFGHPDGNLPWTLVKLPVDFRIFSVSSLGNRWVIGEDQGRVAVQDPPDRVPGDIVDRLIAPWLESQLPVYERVDAISVFDDSIIFALADEKLFRSDDLGETWTLVGEVPHPQSLTEFNGRIFILERTENAPGQEENERESDGLCTLSLREFSDDHDWETLWRINNLPEETICNLRTSYALFDVDGFPVEETGRLFVSVTSNAESPSGNHEMKGGFSTVDGETWCDHGSTETENTRPNPNYFWSRSDYEPWNLLSIPEESSSFPWPDNRSFIRAPYPPQLKQFQINTSTACGGEQLNFQVSEFSNGSESGNFLVQISDDGKARTLQLPEQVNTEWDQLLHHGGTYYGYDGRSIIRTTDFTSWSKSLVHSNTYRLIVGDDHVAQNTRNGLVLENGYISLPNDFNAVVYSKDFEAWCTIQSEYPYQIVEATSLTGGTIEIGRFPVGENDGSYNSIYAAEGQGLLAVSREGAIVLVNADGTYRRINPWGGTVNPWLLRVIPTSGEITYIDGPTLLRTRDWITFEEVSRIVNFPIHNIVEVGDWIYAINNTAVYRRPVAVESAASNVIK